jgi:hypothetical protein
MGILSFHARLGTASAGACAAALMAALAGCSGGAGATAPDGSTSDAGAGVDARSSTGGSAGAAGGAAGSNGIGGATGSGGRSGIGGATGAGGTTGAGGATGLSDEFDGTALGSAWSIFHPELVDVSVGQGALSLRSHANALWYNNNQGVLVYKLVTGDFKATSTVHVRNAPGSTMPPTQGIELGGVMARDPASSQGGRGENYVVIEVGFGEQGHLAIEHKSTIENVSVFDESPFGADAELRLCRVGASFTLWYRAVGATTWVQDDQIARADLAATLQVGAATYADEPAPDLVASFDRLTFAPVGGGCDQ